MMSWRNVSILGTYESPTPRRSSVSTCRNVWYASYDQDGSIESTSSAIFPARDTRTNRFGWDVDNGCVSHVDKKFDDRSRSSTVGGSGGASHHRPRAMRIVFKLDAGNISSTLSRTVTFNSNRVSDDGNNGDPIVFTSPASISKTSRRDDDPSSSRIVTDNGVMIYKARSEDNTQPTPSSSSRHETCTVSISGKNSSTFNRSRSTDRISR